MKIIELQSLAGGVVQEKFSKSFNRIIENLMDPNTPYKNKRKLEIKLSFQQNELRDDVHVDIEVVEKLAPQTAFTTAFSMGKDIKTGECFAREYGKAMPGQMIMEDELPPVMVDDDTGEVLEAPSVIDFRKAAEV